MGAVGGNKMEGGGGGNNTDMLMGLKNSSGSGKRRRKWLGIHHIQSVPIFSLPSAFLFICIYIYKKTVICH